MIKKFLQKVFNKKTKADLAINKADSLELGGAKKITVSTHKINKSLISQAAIKTCEGLQKEGFEAFIVGGAVRQCFLPRDPTKTA